MIQSGVVDASDCPLGGLWPDGYATACGLARARPASLYLQNVYDDEILAAGKDIGVPPVMIKQLIRYESQFWPVQWGPYHFGLGHLTSSGGVEALFWNRGLYEDVLAESPGGAGLPSSLLSLMNAYCPTCNYEPGHSQGREKHPPRGPGGFTLVEIVVVVVIIGLLAAFAGPRIWAMLGFGQRSIAQAKCKEYYDDAMNWRTMSSSKKLPDSLEDMKQPIRPGEPDFTEVVDDAWGNKYVLERDGNKIHIVSWGPDGQEGSDDDIMYPEEKK